MKQKVGFIGLGTMGKPMAFNIQKADYPLGVYNRSPDKMAPFQEQGITTYESARDLARESEAVIIMVTDPEALLAVLQGEQGVLAGLKQGTAVINMSTVSAEATLAAARLVTEGGGKYIDAPVSGTKKPAEDGTLVILAGGRQEEVEAVKPLLLSMGKAVVHCGEIGMGTHMKLTINLLLGDMMQCLAETLVFGAKLGLSSEKIFETINAGPLAAPFYNIKGQAIRTNEFSKKFSIDLIHKDLTLILEAAGKAGVMLPATAAAREVASGARGMGLGDEDMAAIVKVLEKTAGVEIRD